MVNTTDDFEVRGTSLRSLPKVSLHDHLDGGVRPQTIIELGGAIGLELPETEQGPGYGGAILAAVACGEYPSVADACEKLVHVSRRVSPDPSAVEAYDGRYRIWRSLYPALREPFQAMGGRR